MCQWLHQIGFRNLSGVIFNKCVEVGTVGERDDGKVYFGEVVFILLEKEFTNVYT